MTSRWFPVALNLAERDCLVVGSGPPARARAERLLEAGARVTVVMPELTPEIVELEARADIQLARRQFIESDLDQKWLAVLTDSDPVLAARMARAAKDKKVLFCAVDAPEFNSYAHVAVARADTLFLAIGTEGRAPALSRRLREELQRLLDEAGADRFVAALAALRQTTPSADRAARLGQAVAALRFTGRLELPELP